MMIIDSSLWFVLLCYGSVVYINGGSGIPFFAKYLKKLILLVWKL